MSRLVAGPQYPVPYLPAHPGVIFVSHFAAAFDLLGGIPSSQGSAVWPSANRAILVPFEIGSPRIVTQMAWRNGAAVSGNVDAGIYDLLGNRIVAVGGVAQASTSTQQAGDLTDTVLRPGVYLMALVLDNTTGTIPRWAVPTANIMGVHGIRQADTAYPLPSTITIADPSAAFVPFFGVGLRAAMI